MKNILPLALALAACGTEPEAPVANDATAQRPAPNEAGPAEAAEAAPPAPAATLEAPPPAPSLIAEKLVLERWSKAENRARCAPIAFASDGGQNGKPRPATFSGGWAVAFDKPGVRSAYGIAGPALIPEDEAPYDELRRRLELQWPSFRVPPGLPQPSFAGYGRVGALPYTDENPKGLGVHSLAYVRVGGQSCNYNVWSRISRAHLELLIDNLRLVAKS